MQCYAQRKHKNMQSEILHHIFSEQYTIINIFILGLMGFLYVFGLAKIFIKAHKPAWPAFIPLYNILLLLNILDRPQWWILLAFVPFINFIVGLVVAHDLAKAFGKGIGFSIGLALVSPIFIAILGFGDAVYQLSLIHI